MKLLTKEICKREGLKSQTHVGQVREILRCMADIMAEHGVRGDHSALEAEWVAYILKRSEMLRKRSKGGVL